MGVAHFLFFLERPMRRPFIAGNWKMNLTRDSAVELARGIASRAIAQGDVDVAVCPPFVYLAAVREAVQGSAVGLGAQNMYHEPVGAFTGEVSAAMLADVGCRYVILGHSERRHILGETDDAVQRKVLAALQQRLIPIVCVGETLDEREAGRTASVIRGQFSGSLAGLSADQMEQIVIAYEPVWAIGTGRNATPAQAEEVHADLRSLIESRYNTHVASSVRIQYGGSVKPDNAAELLSQPNIDGALVCGASLKVDSFLGIVSAARSKG
jgi:triosephosphate isomerase